MNAQSEKLFGYSREELAGQRIEVLVPKTSQARHPELRRVYFGQPEARAMGLGRDLRARRKDGTEFPVEIGLSPFRTSQGVMALAAVVDISHRKRAETERDLLIAELNHRVKNTLAVVQGIAHQTFHSTEAAGHAQDAFEGRLVALARAHDLLTKLKWERASLEQLARLILKIGSDSPARIRLTGPIVMLAPREALSITMILHELNTNAMKHGALSNDAGQVQVEWSHSDLPARRLSLFWRESGGPTVAPPSRRGFGSRLLERTLASDLDGKVALNFEPSGLICAIEAPLANSEELPR
jgi:PAS domain S-box-containing protein